jgi:hypothetical protein
VHDIPIQPTLLLHPSSACPRCDGSGVRALAHDAWSTMAWYECGHCAYLWAIPKIRFRWVEPIVPVGE